MNKATFDTVIHAPNRLQICALLDSSKELEFQIIREQLDVSDSVLSKHLRCWKMQIMSNYQKR